MKHIRDIIGDIVKDTNIDYKFRQALNPMPDHFIDCDKPAVIKNGDTPYCIKHYKENRRKEDESIRRNKKSTT